MLISVFEVLPTQLSVTIENAIFEEQKEAYILYIGQNYFIKVNFYQKIQRIYLLQLQLLILKMQLKFKMM